MSIAYKESMKPSALESLAGPWFLTASLVGFFAAVWTCWIAGIVPRR